MPCVTQGEREREREQTVAVRVRVKRRKKERERDRQAVKRASSDGFAPPDFQDQHCLRAFLSLSLSVSLPPFFSRGSRCLASPLFVLRSSLASFPLFTRFCRKTAAHCAHQRRLLLPLLPPLRVFDFLTFLSASTTPSAPAAAVLSQSFQMIAETHEMIMITMTR